MQVGTLNIQKLFGREVHYIVPLYQRPYVWNEADQWRPLWEDLTPLADLVAARAAEPEHIRRTRAPIRAHFMGASVQEPQDVPSGDTELRLIIDGQQRLTTIQLLLKAFHDVVSAREFADHAGAIRKLLFNDDPLIKDPAQKRKLQPTRADQEDYQLVMRASSPVDFLHLRETPAIQFPLRNHNIANAYAFFFQEIDGWLGSDPAAVEKRVAGLYGAIRDQLRLVVIDLDDQDDAQAIFETLNARGAPLLSADLIKNFLLSRLSLAEAEAAYQRYWQGFDGDGAFWREQIGRGHAQRARIESFLQYALTILTGHAVSAGHLYNVYRDYATAEDAPQPVEQLARFKRLGDIFRRLHRPQTDYRLSDFYYRLGILDVVTAWPFILALYDRHEREPDVIRSVLLDLESFLVRRMVCRLSTRGYGTVFAGLTKTLADSAGDVVSVVRAALRKGDAEADRWPDDAEFKEAWTTFPLYQNLTRPRLRFLLEAMEQSLRNDFSEEAAAPRRLTIEHIMPQGWRENWPLEPNENPEARDRLVQTIGNLTLLNGKFNQYQSHRPWVDNGEAEGGKRANLNDHSVLQLNKEIVREAQWTEAAIRVRSERLFNIAARLWPRPD